MTFYVFCRLHFPAEVDVTASGEEWVPNNSLSITESDRGYRIEMGNCTTVEKKGDGCKCSVGKCGYSDWTSRDLTLDEISKLRDICDTILKEQG